MSNVGSFRSQNKSIVPARETLIKFARSPVFKNNEFWMVNLLRFKRDTNGSIETSVALYECYVRELSKLENSSQKSAVPILRSNTLHSIFSTTGPWDAILIVEYENAKHFLDLVSSEAYVEHHHYRTDSVEATEMVAVRRPAYPVISSALTMEGNSDLWFEKLRQNPQDDVSDPQNIKPDLKFLTKMIADKRSSWKTGTTKPLWALNFMKFVRPYGREFYKEYGKVAAKQVAKGLGSTGKKKGDGLLVGLEETMTLLGKVDWDTFCVMGYSSLQAFMGLGNNKEWVKAEKQYREKGLKKQGLLLIVPEVINPTRATL